MKQEMKREKEQRDFSWRPSDGAFVLREILSRTLIKCERACEERRAGGPGRSQRRLLAEVKSHIKFPTSCSGQHKSSTLQEAAFVWAAGRKGLQELRYSTHESAHKERLLNLTPFPQERAETHRRKNRSSYGTLARGSELIVLELKTNENQKERTI
ncbi:uncharacterized [Tachysurus ichikawai]